MLYRMVVYANDKGRTALNVEAPSLMEAQQVVEKSGYPIIIDFTTSVVPMRYVYPNGIPVELPAAQFNSVVAQANRWGMRNPVTVHPYVGVKGPVLLDVGSMVLVIEDNGHCHT